MEAGLQPQEWWWCNHIASAFAEVHPLGAMKEEGQAGACRASYRKRSSVGYWRKAGSVDRCERLCWGCNERGVLAAGWLWDGNTGWLLDVLRHDQALIKNLTELNRSAQTKSSQLETSSTLLLSKEEMVHHFKRYECKNKGNVYEILK